MIARPTASRPVPPSNAYQQSTFAPTPPSHLAVTNQSRHQRTASGGSLPSQRRIAQMEHSVSENDFTSPTNGNSSMRSRHDIIDVEKGLRASRNAANEQDPRGLKKRHKLTAFRIMAVIAATSLALITLFALYFYFSADSTSDVSDQSVTFVTVLTRVESPVYDDLEWEMPSNDMLAFAAIGTWYKLVAPKSIVLYALDESVCKYAQSAWNGVQCFHRPECAKAEFRQIPDLSCLYRHLINEVETGSTIALLNPDIGLDNRFMSSVQYVDKLSSKSDRRWLMVGTRVDVILTVQALRGYSDPAFPQRLSTEADARGILHDGHAIDCLVGSKAVIAGLVHPSHFPPFLAAAGQWSNHLLAKALLDSTIRVVDMSQTAPLIHISTIGAVGLIEPHRASSTRSDEAFEADASAVAFNSRLSSTDGIGVKQAFGDVKYAPLALEGVCPSACIVSTNSNGLYSTMFSFTSRVNPDGYLAVLTVNSGYLPLAMNWICWAHRINFTNFILLAEDRASAEALRSPQVTVITKPRAPQRKEAADYGSVEFQETMSYRTEFLMEVLEAGFHFMTADMDAIWLSDPFKHVDLKADLSGQTHKKTKLSGGLVIVRASDTGISFWKQVIQCQRRNAKYLSEHATGTYEPSMYTEQYCINELYVKQPPPPAFTRTLLDPWLFPDGKFFFDEQQTQHAGVVPVIIHNNWIKGAGAKLQRQKEWGLLSTNDDYTACEPMRGPPAAELSTTGDSLAFTLAIRIISHTSHEALLNLLNQLAALDWNKFTPITLQVDIDRMDVYDPDSTPLNQIVDYDARHKQLVDAARQFRWSHGPDVVVHQNSERKGHMAQFLANWPQPFDDRTVMLFLDEACNVSSILPSVIHSVVQQYYLDPVNYDPRLLGLTLETEDAIIGEVYEHRYPTRSATGELAKLTNPPVIYGYQTFSPIAQLMFPRPMQVFRQFVHDNQIDLGSALPPATTNARITPCIPLVRTNEWFYPLSRHPDQVATGALRLGALGVENADAIFESSLYEPEEVWWAWILRFMYDQGMFSVDLHSEYSLIEHPTGKLGRFLPAELRLQLPLQQTWSADPLPLLNTLPVYEFHFQPVANSNILSVLSHLYPRFVRHQCYQLVEYEMEVRGRMDAFERIKSDEAARAHASSKRKGKDGLSDEMRAAKRKADLERMRLEEEAAMKLAPRMEVEEI